MTIPDSVRTFGAPLALSWQLEGSTALVVDLGGGVEVEVSQRDLPCKVGGQVPERGPDNRVVVYLELMSMFEDQYCGGPSPLSPRVAAPAGCRPDPGGATPAPSAQRTTLRRTTITLACSHNPSP